jgi:uncharacterized membrane protein YqjE
MSEDGTASGGVFKSLQGLLDTGLLMVENRVELFSVEFQAERCRIAEAIILTAAAVAMGMMTLSLITLTVILLFWESARLAALLGLSGLYLTLTVAAFRSLSVRLKSRTAFAGTLEELKKDRACLATPNSPDSNSANAS